MRFRNQLSITGETGVGSSTMLKGLRDEFFAKLPYRFVSGGAIMRAKAAELGMTIEAFAQHNREHPEDGYDKMCDETIARFAEQDFVICEGRLPHFFMPDAFHVLMTCDLWKRAERRQGQEGYKDMSVADIVHLISHRDHDDNTRYRRLYPGCIWSPHKFDLIVDTTDLSKEGSVKKVLDAYAARQTQPALV